MHRNTGTTFTRRARLGLLAAALTLSVVATACSEGGPTPGEQREATVRLTDSVVAAFVEGLDMTGIDIVASSAVPVPCGDGDGTQFIHTVHGSTARFAQNAGDVDGALATADTQVVGILTNMAERPGFELVDARTQPGGPATRSYRAKDGDAAGATVGVTLTPADNGHITIEVTGSTVCG